MPGSPGVLDRARKIITEGLFRNSAFLFVNLIVSSVTGYGSLSLLTHLFSVQAVGLSATAYSSCSLIISLTLFGTNYSVPRYLPTTAHRNELINSLLTAVIFSAMLASIIFLALPYAQKLFALGGWIFGVVFVASVCLQAGEAVMQLVIIADRTAGTLVKVSAVPNASKLAAPLVFSPVGALGAYAARVLYDLFAFVIMAVVLAKRGQRFRPMFSMAATKDIRRFSVGMYVASLIGGLPMLALPIIVLARVGQKESAYWSIAMTIASFLFSMPSLVNQALLPEMSSRPTERRRLLRRSAIMITALVAPTLLVAYFAAPIALAFFGQSYVVGSLAALRWLIFAGFIAIINHLTGTILVIAKKSSLITVVNIIDAVIIFGLANFWATSDREIAIAWFVGEIANVLFFGLFALLAIREVSGRWEALGESQVASASAVDAANVIREFDISRTGQLAGLNLLIELAEQQQDVEFYKPYQFPVTSPYGLFSMVEIAATERRRAQLKAEQQFSESAEKRALNLLFQIAEQQRSSSDAGPHQ